MKKFLNDAIEGNHGLVITFWIYYTLIQISITFISLSIIGYPLLILAVFSIIYFFISTFALFNSLEMYNGRTIWKLSGYIILYFNFIYVISNNPLYNPWL